MMISKSQLKVSLTILLITLVVSQGCAGVSTPLPMSALPAAMATSTLVPTNIPQPTGMQPPYIVKPFVTGPRLRFDSWSPDSKWFAYWIANSNNAPAHLAFVDIQANKICEHEEVSANGLESGGVKWLDDGTVNIVDYSGEKAFHGIPCETFSETKFIPPSHNESFLSPDGRYRAETIINGWEGELTHNVTTITEILTKKIAVFIRWNGSPQVWAESGWLRNQLYLIGLDVNRGALYVSVPDGKVGNVVSDLLGLDIQSVGYISRVGRYTDTMKGEYHLLLVRSIDLPLLLYHSELNRVEELSFHESLLIGGFTFSPDGKWLFFSQPSSAQNNGIEDFWIREVDTPGSSPSRLAEGMNFAGFSNEAHKIILIDKNYILHVLNFPRGETISLWNPPDYQIDRVWWSPDGKRVVMQGFPVKSQSEAIFMIEP